MVGSRVFVVKERDEWSNFAEFVGAMVAKYADKMDFESLPDPDLYLLKEICWIGIKHIIGRDRKKYILMLNMLSMHDNLYSYK